MNNDELLSPGESATVYIYAQNTGSSDALDVWGKLESFSEHVTIDEIKGWSSSSTSGRACVSTDWSCENISDPRTLDKPYADTFNWITAIGFTLDSDAPLTPIQFDLSFHDSLNYSWDDSFQLEVVR